MRCLVAGGAGYIGSHTCVELLEHGYEVIIADNFCNSRPGVIDRIRQITGRDFAFYPIDICDREALDRVFREHQIDCVLHFAGYKAVGESVSLPHQYYDNNLNTTLSLCKAMLRYNVDSIVFSSSATVYSGDNTMPLTEESRTGCSNPYGRTKQMCEQILTDMAAAHGWRVALLRYFNPLGAHESGLIGEAPLDIPNNLLPYLTQVAAGQLKELTVYGDDYDTPDGTGVRDYLHVADLAAGHLAAIGYLRDHPGVEVFNLSTGRGHSVLEVVKTFERVNGTPIPYRIGGRRPGDLGCCYADPGKAWEKLRWTAKKTLEEMCRDSWRWQQKSLEISADKVLT